MRKGYTIMKKSCYLLLMLLLLTGQNRAGAEPDLTLRDGAAYAGSWTSAYVRILQDHSAGIQAYQDYVAGITYNSVCRPVGLMDLTGNGIPELLFWDLVDDTEYGFQVGRLWIYTRAGEEVRCALTFQPEIDDLLYSRYYLAKDGRLTIQFSDCEMGWIMRFRPDANGTYSAEITLIEQMDFSGEGPDLYFRNGAKISRSKYESQVKSIRENQGTMIGSLQVEEGGCGFSHTLAEAQEVLASGKIAGGEKPGAGSEASPSGGSPGRVFPELSFQPGSFTAGQLLPVYSAPSTRSWRGANGKAAVTSGSEIFIAGKTDGWMLILYELNSGVTRVGYTSMKNIKGDYTAGNDLSFCRIPMTLAEDTVMTDDPVRQTTSVGSLKKGTSVLCLAEYQGWIYVETTVKGKTARGFIAAASLGLD